MIALLGTYFFISLVVAAPFLARYIIVSLREHKGAKDSGLFAAEVQPMMDHFEQKFLQRF